jgi:hypothetical protein
MPAESKKPTTEKPLEEMTDRELAIFNARESKRRNDLAEAAAKTAEATRAEDLSIHQMLNRPEAAMDLVAKMKADSERDGCAMESSTVYVVAVHTKGPGFLAEPAKLACVLQCAPCRDGSGHRVVNAMTRDITFNPSWREMYLFPWRDRFLRERAARGAKASPAAPGMATLNARLDQVRASLDKSSVFQGGEFDAPTEQIFLFGDGTPDWRGSMHWGSATEPKPGHDFHKARTEFINKLTVIRPGELTRNATLREATSMGVVTLVELLADKDSPVTVDPFSAPDRTREIMTQIYPESK